MAKTKYFYSEQNQKQKNKIICEKIRDIPIQDYAVLRGFQITRKGKYFQIVGKKGINDCSSVMINSETNRYKRYAYDTRPHSIIDFVMMIDNCDQATAINKLKPLIDTYDLEKAIPVQPHSKAEYEQKDLLLPERADSIKNVYAYLSKTRYINKDIIDHFIYNDNLYQDKHNNCVFVRYDRQGKPTYCFKRGTNTFSKKRFMWEDPHNDLKHCFFIDNASDILIVNEGIIDTMSIMSIMQDRGNKINDFSYVSLGGTGKWEAVHNILNENPCIKKVVLALDNDDAGFKNMNNIRKDVSENFPGIITTEFLPKTENDWNEQLKFNRLHGISTSLYLKNSREKIILLANQKEVLQKAKSSNILQFEHIGGVSDDYLCR